MLPKVRLEYSRNWEALVNIWVSTEPLECLSLSEYPLDEVDEAELVTAVCLAVCVLVVFHERLDAGFDERVHPAVQGHLVLTALLSLSVKLCT